MRRLSAIIIVAVAAASTMPTLLLAQECLGQPINIFNVSFASQNASAVPMQGRLTLSVDDSYAALTVEQRALPGSQRPATLFGIESIRAFRSPDNPWASCLRMTAAISRRQWDHSGDVSVESTRGMISMGVAFARRVEHSDRLTLLPNAGVYVVGGGITYKAASARDMRPPNVLREGLLVTAGLSLLLPSNFSIQPHLQIATRPDLLGNAVGVSMSYGFFSW